jgi:hypothetical protein
MTRFGVPYTNCAELTRGFSWKSTVLLQRRAGAGRVVEEDGPVPARRRGTHAGPPDQGVARGVDHLMLLAVVLPHHRVEGNAPFLRGQSRPGHLPKETKERHPEAYIASGPIQFGYH